MDLENLSPFQRKLIFHNVKPHHPELYFETISVTDPEERDDDDAKDSSSSESLPDEPNVGRTKASRSDSKCHVLRITKLSEAEQIARETEKRQKDLATISKNVGFSKVIRKMKDVVRGVGPLDHKEFNFIYWICTASWIRLSLSFLQGKLIIGHNALLDVTHTIHQFLADLPDNLAEFKLMVQETFPNLVDTKYMSSSGPFRELIPSHVLFDLAKRIQQDPFQLPSKRQLILLDLFVLFPLKVNLSVTQGLESMEDQMQLGIDWVIERSMKQVSNQIQFKSHSIV